ncbi:MAG: hypothetical protein LH630_05845 [Actinomycetia bacterium]|nr:hypothetical protein [Actinomycetes bacterium]
MTDPAGALPRPLRTVRGLFAALVGLALLLAGILVGAVPAAAQNGVGASTPVMINSVGVSTDIGAGQRLGKTVLQPRIVVATGVAAETSVDALSPAIRANVDDAIQRAASGKIRFPGHDGKVYDNSDGLLPQGGHYTEWTAAQSGAKRGADRVIISGDPANPDAIFYWDHVNPPVRIGP